MKTYSVNIKAYATVVVEAKSAAEALDIAVDETRLGDLEFDEGGPVVQIKGKEEIERAKRHCDKFLKYEAI